MGSKSARKLRRNQVPKKQIADMIVHNNYVALWNKYPDTAKRLQAVSIGPESKYAVVKANPNCYYPTLIIKENNTAYYDPNDPFGDAKKNIDLLTMKNTRIAFFCGMGLGYEVMYYIKEKAKDQCTFAIIVVEKDIEIFKHAMNTVDLTQIINNPKLTLVVGLEDADLFAPFRNFLVEDSKFMLMKACNGVFHQSSVHMYHDYYKKALEIFLETAKFQVANFGNDPYDSFIGIDNMLANLDTIITNPGINLLYNKFKGKPAIVVATGPSLDKNKNLLKGLEDKALIVAVDAAMKILYPMGVKPHMYSSLERVMFVTKLFDEMPDDAYEDAFLAACPVVRPEVYDVYKGPTIIAYRNFDHFKWLPIDRGIIDSKFSAGNMAFKIAQVLGCDPIILIGQDLSFKKDLTQTHAIGSSLGDLQKDFFDEGLVPVKGNYEDEVPTSKTFFNCIKGYEVDLVDWKGTCINATEGGAYIHGTKVMTFKEAIDKYLKGPSFNSVQIIKDAIASFQGKDLTTDKIKVRDLIEKTVADFVIMLDETKIALDLITANEDKLKLWMETTTGDEAILKELTELEHQVTEAKYTWFKRFFNSYQLFFMHVFQSQHIRIEMDIAALPGKYDLPALAIADSILHQKEWYEKFVELANVCLKRLEETRMELANF